MKNNLTRFDLSGKTITVIFLLFFVLLFAGCGMKKEFEFSGKTMGTTYHIKAVAGYLENTKMLKDEIDMRLEEINKSMSTFRKDSEISRFNAFQTIGEKFKISDDFYNVMTVAKTIYEETGGAWDGTVKPLVDLWGFGKSENNHTIPEKSRIAALLSNIGFNNIVIYDDHYLAKKNTAITLDLASIAKGYGVDQVAALIRANRINDFLVEIGGEVFAGRSFVKTAKSGGSASTDPRKTPPSIRSIRWSICKTKVLQPVVTIGIISKSINTGFLTS